MFVFMPYYRQPVERFLSHSHPRSSINQQNNQITTNPEKSFLFVCGILSCCVFSMFLLITGLTLLRTSPINDSNQNKGSPIIAIILLTIAIILFIGICQRLKQYFAILDSRRRLVQRLRERQQACDLTITLNNDDNSSNITTDLPAYKELFPSHLNLNNNDNDLPSYNDFVEKRVIYSSINNLSIRSHSVSLPSISSQSSTNCIRVTDRTRRPFCIDGSVTYV